MNDNYIYDLHYTTVPLAGGREIMVVLEENEHEVRFYENGEEIDSSKYVAFVESDAGNYFIDHMFPPITRCGLGTEALLVFKDSISTKLIIQPYGSPRELPGSVLPEAQPFFNKMIGKGIVEDNSDF